MSNSPEAQTNAQKIEAILARQKQALAKHSVEINRLLGYIAQIRERMWLGCEMTGDGRDLKRYERELQELGYPILKFPLPE